MTTWASENTEVILGIAAAVGTLAGAILVANGAMAAWGAITAVTAALNAVLGASFTALWVATGVGIVIVLIGVIVTLQMKFNILGRAVDLLKVAFDKLWDGIKWVINKVIDAVNLLIRAWNKLPLVPDIEEITFKFQEMGDTVRDVSSSMARDHAAAKESVVESTLAYDDLKLSLQNYKAEAETAIEETAPKLAEGFGDVTTAITQLELELAALYNELTREEAVERFQDSIDTMMEALGTDEFEGALRDAKLAVFALAEELGYLSPMLQEELILAIDTGDAERLDLILQSIAENWSAFSGERFPTFTDWNFNGTSDEFWQQAFETAQATGILDFFGFGASDFNLAPPTELPGGGGMASVRSLGGDKITINMPTGSNGDDVVRALQREQRRKGALPLAANGARR